MIEDLIGFALSGSVVTVVSPSGNTNGIADTAAIQTALNAANVAGGAIVRLAAGTYYLNATLTFYSNTRVVGAGPAITTVQLANGANTDMLVSNGFAGLTGGGTSGGVVSCGFADLTIDGNKANNPSGGAGIKHYGAILILDRVIVRNCQGDGLYSEWSSSAVLTDGCEGHLTSVTTHDNGGNGITWAGPHDSTWDGCVSFLNGGHGFHLKAGSAITVCTNCHAWGTTHDYAWYVESRAFLHNCQGEGASIAECLIGANNCEIIGGEYFGAGTNTIVDGIIIGDGTHTNITGTLISGASINTCTNHGGIYAQSISGLQLIGNTLYANNAAGSGVDISIPTARGVVMVEGNYCKSFHSINVAFISGSALVQVANNTFDGDASYTGGSAGGTTVQSTGNIFTNVAGANQMKLFAQAGVAFICQSTGDSFIGAAAPYTFSNGATVIVRGSQSSSLQNKVLEGLLSSTSPTLGVCYGTAAPTSGTFIQGDTCINTTPAAAGTPGWVCTTGGTPGTWKARAAVAA